MTMAKLSHIARRDLWGIDRVAVEAHLCPLCSNRDPLAPALAPYSVAALRGDERCFCATAPPLPAHEAGEALRVARDDIGDAVRAGARRILWWFWRRRVT